MNQEDDERKLIHTRRVECNAYQRRDGLIEVEGEIRDISPDGTQLRYKQVEAGGLIHHMRIVMTVGEDLVIRSVKADTLAAPTPDCPEIASAYASLAGLKIGGGFSLELKKRVGDVKGCTHLTELFGPLATTAFQAVFALQRTRPGRHKHLEGDGPVPRPLVAGTCYPYRLDGKILEVIWPKHRRIETPKVS